MNPEIYISLGSNLGDRRKNIGTAIGLISEIPGIKVEKVSQIIETEPWGFASAENFLNCAAEIVMETQSENPEQDALKLLDQFKRIERSLGRSDAPEFDEDGKRVYHSRTIDIDILFYGNYIIDNDRLTVPHKNMSDRDFVMIPLNEIASPDIKSEFPDIFNRPIGE